MTSYKGFSNDLKCRDFQYEIGKTFEHEGKVKVCNSGFHACEHPLDVFRYYAPSTSRFAEVECGGDISRDNDDTKIACSKISIGLELSFTDMISAPVKFVFDRADWTNVTTQNDIKRGAASATGYSGAASATGRHSVACGLGNDCKAKGALGCAIVLVERFWNGDSYEIKDIKAAKVDGEIIKADTFYSLVDGEFTEMQ